MGKIILNLQLHQLCMLSKNLLSNDEQTTEY